MRKSKLRQVIEAVIAITQSHQKVHTAIIADLETLEQRIRTLESYVQLLEERRDAELEHKVNG